MAPERVLVSGGGIAGLTLAILLKEAGWDPLVIEREGALRTEGYMMDFFGTGWDVAERMDLVDALHTVRYPIDHMQYVGDTGEPYLSVPIERLRRGLDGRYVYLRRSDLERILYERAQAAGVDIRFGCSIHAIDEHDRGVTVTFADGMRDAFALVVGADGVHSRVRELVFGDEERFARFLGYYVAAFHIRDRGYGIGRAVKLHEEPDRLAMFYPLDAETVDATYVVRDREGHVAPEQRLAFVRERFDDTHWIAARVLDDLGSSQPLYFDPASQIVMPEWHRGRTVLIGDACGCLTLLAGQGSHMAMAGAYVLAHELGRHGDHRAAFAAYQRFVQPIIVAKQRYAVRLSRRFVPSARSPMWLRHIVIRLMLSPLFVKYAWRWLGSRSALVGYP